MKTTQKRYPESAAGRKIQSDALRQLLTIMGGKETSIGHGQRETIDIRTYPDGTVDLHIDFLPLDLAKQIAQLIHNHEN